LPDFSYGIDMKTHLAVAIVLLAMGASTAYAGCARSQDKLTKAQVDTILAGNYACGRSAANAPGWNERHTGSSGGSLVEQHLGGSTVETVGIWATSTAGSVGRVTYTYTGGGIYVYEIAVLDPGGTLNCNSSGDAAACVALPQTYEFCRVSPAGTALQIRVTTSSIAPPLTNCPNN
jgi:hypothetical protein